MKTLKIQSLANMIAIVATVLYLAACREQDNEKVDPVLNWNWLTIGSLLNLVSIVRQPLRNIIIL